MREYTPPLSWYYCSSSNSSIFLPHAPQKSSRKSWRIDSSISSDSSDFLSNQKWLMRPARIDRFMRLIREFIASAKGGIITPEASKTLPSNSIGSDCRVIYKYSPVGLWMMRLIVSSSVGQTWCIWWSWKVYFPLHSNGSNITLISPSADLEKSSAFGKCREASDFPSKASRNFSIYRICASLELRDLRSLFASLNRLYIGSESKRIIIKVD